MSHFRQLLLRLTRAGRDHVAAARRELAARGQHRLPIPDLLIAAWAQQHGADVVPRGRGLASALMHELEALAAERGLVTLRLDTRDDLVEACRLYARLGYREVERFNDSPYSDHWLRKDLTK